MIRIIASLILVALGVGISLSSEMLPLWAEEHSAALHLIGSSFLHMGAGVVFFTVMDTIVQPWLKIRDVLDGSGAFTGTEIKLRVAFVSGYYLLFAAVLVGFAWAGV